MQAEAFPTFLAFTGLFSHVSPLMLSKKQVGTEGSASLTAVGRLLSRIGSWRLCEVWLLLKAPYTPNTGQSPPHCAFSGDKLD